MAPDGSSLRVTYGVLNLTHRDGHERPLALEPGHRHRVVVHLNDVAHAFPQGHVRVAVSTCYWPVLWLGFELVTLTLFTEPDTWICLCASSNRDEELLPAGPPEQAPVPERRAVTHNRPRSREHDPTTGEIVSIAFRDGGESGTAALSQVPDIDLDFGHAFRRTHRIRDDDPYPGKARAGTALGAAPHRLARAGRLLHRADRGRQSVSRTSDAER